MLDVKQQVVESLKEVGINVCYELFYDSTTPTPCITYYEYLNQDDLTGDTFGYSEIGFTVTVWASSIVEMEGYAIAVDTQMRDLGFKRVASSELTQGNLIRKILDYKCLGKETY